MDDPAGPAAIARPADADDPEPCRYMIEHLADRLADQMQLAAAAGTGPVLNIEPSVLARQVRRQAWLCALRPQGSGLGRRELGFSLREIDVEVLQGEPQLVVIELLGPPAELATLQLLDDEMEPFDLRLRLAENGTFGRSATICCRAHYPAGPQDRCSWAEFADSRLFSDAWVESISRSDRRDGGSPLRSVRAIVPPIHRRCVGVSIMVPRLGVRGPKEDAPSRLRRGIAGAVPVTS